MIRRSAFRNACIRATQCSEPSGTLVDILTIIANTGTVTGRRPDKAFYYSDTRWRGSFINKTLIMAAITITVATTSTVTITHCPQQQQHDTVVTYVPLLLLLLLLLNWLLFSSCSSYILVAAHWSRGNHCPSATHGQTQANSIRNSAQRTPHWSFTALPIHIHAQTNRRSTPHPRPPHFLIAIVVIYRSTISPFDLSRRKNERMEKGTKDRRKEGLLLR